MAEVVQTVLPIFLLILLGHLFQRTPLLDLAGWRALERLTYFVLFPCLLTTALADTDFSQLAIGAVVAAIAGAQVAVSLMLLLTRNLLARDGPAFTSVYQGCVRMNTYVGLSIAAAFYGSAGLTAAALAIAIIVPLVNVTCVLVLAWFGTAGGAGWAGVLGAWLKNPLILASFLGIGLNLTGVGLPPIVGPMAEILAQAALPLGLLAVGAALDLRAVHAARGIVAFTAVVKLALLPGLTFVLLRLMDTHGVESSVAILFNALPTATSSYILASQYGGDARLMASITSAQTLLSMLTLPAVIAVLM